MNYDYPDLGGSVHAIFDTQLPGAAIDSPSQTQDSIMSLTTAANRRAEKAPAQNPNPPSFSAFNEVPYSSCDRTQEPLFPATIGSISQNSDAPEPATAHQTMMVAICKTTGLMEIFNHKIDNLYNNSIKTNARVNLLSHAMEEVIETRNKNLIAFEKLQRTLDDGNTPTRPATMPHLPVPLPPKPVPEVVITRPRPTEPARQPTKPLTPPDHSLNANPSGAGPSRPLYAAVAEGEFQPVIRKNRNHRNRTPHPSPATSPDTQPDRDRQIVVVSISKK